MYILWSVPLWTDRQENVTKLQLLSTGSVTGNFTVEIYSHNYFIGIKKELSFGEGTPSCLASDSLPKLLTETTTILFKFNFILAHN